MSEVDGVPGVLREAAAIIRRRGWSQGSCSTPTVPCAGIAIDLAAEDQREVAVLAYEALLRFLGLKADAGSKGIICWNDVPGRTQDEVVSALEGAAGKAEGGDDHG